MHLHINQINHKILLKYNLQWHFIEQKSFLILKIDLIKLYKLKFRFKKRI
jgi:hypothetical protein